MHQSITIFIILMIFHLAIEQVNCKNTPSKSLTYPKVKRIPKVWSFPATHGNVSYTDPYYWMESVNETDSDLQTFLNDQVNLTESCMHQCNDQIAIKQALKAATQYDQLMNLGLWGEEKGNPTYVYSLLRYGEQRPTWYVATPSELDVGRKNNMNPPPGRPFLKESLLSSDVTATILMVNLSPDAKTFGYLTADTNSDLATWYWRSINSPLLTAKSTPKGGEGRLPLTIPFTTRYADLIWFSDGSGFFYHQGADTSGGGSLDEGFKVLYHNWTHEDISKDIFILSADQLGVNKTISISTFFYFVLSADNRWLIVSGYYNTDGKVRTYATLLTNQTISDNMKWISLAPDFDFQMFPMTIIGDWFYYQTDENAPNSKVVKMKLDFTNAKTIRKFNELQDRPKRIEVVKERKDANFQNGVASSFALAHDKAVLIYVENGKNVVYLYDLLTGKQLAHLIPNETLAFPKVISDPQSNKLYLYYQNFATPSKTYEIVYADDKAQSNLMQAQNVAGTKSSDFKTEQFYATSKDGTKVPYFVSSKKGMDRTGLAWVHAYASYGEIESLFFEEDYFVFIEKYGPLVWCGARGGGEEGGEWHTKGEGVHKQNTFDDIIACCEDLVKRGIALKGSIIVEGGSAGGLAMAAVVNQAPQGLIGVALFVHAVFDLFGFELRSVYGPNNVQEFGDVNKPDEVQTVLKYSPYQNIDPKRTYPAVLVQVGTEDTIAPPNQAYRYLAQLQYTHPNSTVPLIMYLNTGEGHLANTATDAMIDESMHQLCLVEIALGAKMHKR